MVGSIEPHILSEQVLIERFNISSGFHPGQLEIIELLLEGKRVLAIQRTGWGKSLCYQLASLYYPHLTIVFSPLKALMRDQCQRCNDVYHIPAAIVSSDFTEVENSIVLEQAVKGQLKLLFIAPERLNNALWQSYVYKMSISMIVIDEAHCISTWGHDFRPQYRRIVKLLNAIPQNTPVLALTATANKRVEADILAQMGAEVMVVRGTMRRPNLHIKVLHLQGDHEKLHYLGQLLPLLPGTGIIYTATQRDAEVVAAFLVYQGFVAEYYHAGREDDVRREVEEKLMGNAYKVVCSTNALGMGIDKRDIRFIIHYHIPASPIHYYQEIGRAGRDGDIARCILFYDPEDMAIQKYFITTAKPASNCYEAVLSLIRVDHHGLRERDLLRRTGYSQTMVRTILADLEDRGMIERDPHDRTFTALERFSQTPFVHYDDVQAQKLRELNDIENYVQCRGCYITYLTTYLGDQPGDNCQVCSNCWPANFPSLQPSERMSTIVTHFLEYECLPRIEKRGSLNAPSHEAGWALSYHGSTPIGRLVRASKYENAGPFAETLVTRATEVIRTRFPIDTINGIISVPPTRSGILVEDFSRRVAAALNIEYVSVVVKVRSTQEQKHCTNWLQKSENVKGAFTVESSQTIAGCTLLLIDDIYDSGQMLREIAKVLLQAGALAVHPFTITKTKHADDQ